jgi:imidazolonepropionase-like amidohydrolase
MVLSLRRDYPAIKLVLVGATEGWMVAQDIAAARVPVIAAALADLPFSFESLAATETNVGRLTRAGVSAGISTVDINTAPGEHVLAQYAGNLVAIGKVPRGIGLDWGQAFATITSKPAAALGMDGEIGSLRAGRRADVVIWDGDPLELSSAPEQVFIDGRAQPMDSRQKLLQRRYATPTEGALPKAYDR